MKSKFLFVLLIDISVIICINNDGNNDDDFLPTHQWQVVRKGQKIPKGLHVRINLKTGLTEAKLLDENEKQHINALLKVPQESQDEDKKPLNSHIKEALTKIKNDDVLNFDGNTVTEKGFRTYDVLKNDLNDLNLTPKVDAEILNDLFQQHKEETRKVKTNSGTIMQILEDFEFLAHQFDNALEFVKLNGFREIIYKELNATDSQIKLETLKLFGSLVQNNAKVQVHALETGAIGILLRILNLELSTEVKSRAVHAVSCLLRRFPFAQLKFVENGGLSVMTKILEKDSVKIQVKVVTLMNDLLLENLHALPHVSSDNQKIRLRQYRLVNFEGLLLEQGWCRYLNTLLYSLMATDPNDHDLVEKCIIPMHTIKHKCVIHYSTDLLSTLHERYKILALNDLHNGELNNSDFFSKLQEMCGDILLEKNMKYEL